MGDSASSGRSIAGLVVALESTGLKKRNRSGSIPLGICSRLGYGSPISRHGSTRRNYFVKLSDDGQLQIHGVQPGNHDLVIRLYEEPAGCLLETIGKKSCQLPSPQRTQLPVKWSSARSKAMPHWATYRVRYAGVRFTDASGRICRIDEIRTVRSAARLGYLV